MARVQTMVQLTDELVERLDGEARRRGVSRSAVIRQAVVTFFEAEREDTMTARIVAGYERIPQGTPDEWGDLAAQTDRSTLETLQRLDAEEREAGVEPW